MLPHGSSLELWTEQPVKIKRKWFYRFFFFSVGLWFSRTSLLIYGQTFKALPPLTPLRHTQLHSPLLFSLGDSSSDSFSSCSPPSFSLHLHPLSYFQVVSDQLRILISTLHTLTGTAPLPLWPDLDVTAAWDSPSYRETVSRSHHCCLWFPYEIQQQQQSELAWTTDFQFYIETESAKHKYLQRQTKDC